MNTKQLINLYLKDRLPEKRYTSFSYSYNYFYPFYEYVNLEELSNRKN